MEKKSKNINVTIILYYIYVNCVTYYSICYLTFHRWMTNQCYIYTYMNIIIK